MSQAWRVSNRSHVFHNRTSRYPHTRIVTLQDSRRKVGSTLAPLLTRCLLLLITWIRRVKSGKVLQVEQIPSVGHQSCFPERHFLIAVFNLRPFPPQTLLIYHVQLSRISAIYNSLFLRSICSMRSFLPVTSTNPFCSDTSPAVQSSGFLIYIDFQFHLTAHPPH